MKTVPLNANVRSDIGSQKAKKIRANKRVPAVVYGKGMKTVPIDVSRDEFKRAIHTKAGENVIIKLRVEGAKKIEKNVVIKEIQHDCITEAIDHIDFNAISMTEKIRVKVPLKVIGDAAGVKEGGILDVVHHEIEVECFPTDIPEKFEIDVAHLAIGQAAQLSELKISQGVTPILGPEDTIVAVHAPRVEEEPTDVEAPTEPELIGKKKDEEGEEEPEAAKDAPKKEEPKEKKE